MDSQDLQNEAKRISNLVQNKKKNLSEDELLRMAKINLQTKHFSSLEMFDDVKEKQLAEDRFKSYLDKFEFESDSDIDTLASLIFNEIFEIRLQKELNKLSKPDENGNTKYINPKLTEQLTQIQDQKLALKVKLGIDKEDKEDAELTSSQKLWKRFDEYILDHYNEFVWAYPYECTKCGHQDVEMTLARRRVKDFTLMKHPWSAGRWLFNYSLFKFVKDGTLTKEQAWEVLSTSGEGGEYIGSFSKEYCVSYIDYVLEHWQEVTETLKAKT